MGKPTILTVDDDAAVSAAITRDLRARYGADYRVVRATSGGEALTLLDRLARRDQPVALITADQRMPQMTGTEMLARSRVSAPDAKLLLLTAYADTDVAITAINEIGLDHYLLKPWDPPAEHLYPVTDDLLDSWRREHPDLTVQVRVVGHRWSEQSYTIKDFLARNHVPYRWCDVECDAEGQRLLELTEAAPDDLPLVFVPDADPLRSPTVLELAGALGLRTHATERLYDVCIIGGGPAGLAAAVYAASEGLSTVVVESDAPGGQAGRSASIENYLGFPKGLSGADLAQRAHAQASRFGAEMVLARRAQELQVRGPTKTVRFDEPGQIEARAVIVASGVRYRQLDAPGLDRFTGCGVYYGLNASDAQQCQGADVYLVGGANSAGQAALNLARCAKRVVMLVRGASLEATMSQYLVGRIAGTPEIEVRLTTEVTSASGVGHLERLTVCDRSTGRIEEVATNWMFVFVGGTPQTNWLGAQVNRDAGGFVRTGIDAPIGDGDAAWPLHRSPYSLETSVPGIFAAGDVRGDSMKRVASAVGEGAMAVYFVHRYLASM